MTQNIFSSYDVISDVAANRPATPTVANGRLCVFMATDTGTISFWNGSAWADLPVGVTESSGTWTPVLQFGGASTGITYSAQVGAYIETNHFVWVSLNVTLTSKGIATGLATVSGLPFPSINIASAFPAFVLPYSPTANFASLSPPLMAVLSPGSSTISLEQNSGTSTVTDANFTNTSAFAGAFTYRR